MSVVKMHLNFTEVRKPQAFLGILTIINLFYVITIVVTIS